MDEGMTANLWVAKQSFFQADTIKGARYLDDAGRIMNEYRDDYENVSVGLDGLVMREPKSQQVPDEIRVDVNRIWFGCYGDDSIEKVVETVAPIARRISQLIGVEFYKRLGLRAYYFKATPNLETYARQLFSKVATAELGLLIGSTDQVADVVFRTRVRRNPFSISLAFAQIHIIRPPSTRADFESDGAIIDIDVAENDQSSRRELNQRHIGLFLSEAAEHVRSKAREAILFLRETDDD